MFDSTSTHHRCRHRHCKQWLETPTTNSRDAFCCAKCDEAFYRTHCRVCEQPITSKNSRRQVCGRPRCRGQIQRHPDLFFGVTHKSEKGSTKSTANPAAETGRHSPSLMFLKPGKSSTKSTSFLTIKPARPWRVVAGPELTPAQLNCATISDGAAGGWECGERERLEARNTAKLREHFRKRVTLIGPSDPPVNILGGYRFPGAPEIGLFGSEVRP
jgi:hypothetical protein